MVFQHEPKGAAKAFSSVSLRAKSDLAGNVLSSRQVSGLTRKQRRSLERSGAIKREAVYTLTQSQIDAMKEEVYQKASKKAADIASQRVFFSMLALPLLAARDEFSFGEGRLKRLLHKTLYLYDSYVLGYMTDEDCINQIKEEVGFDLIDVAMKWSAENHRDPDRG